jgi:3-hydroxyisobutyrate dehydrogenase-like beta-hydroxyacid dehydrogenase
MASIGGLQRIALIGFGEVGGLMARDLVALGLPDVGAFDIAFDREDSAPSRAIAQSPVRRFTAAAQAASGAQLVVSAVTAGSTLAAARAAADGIGQGAWYLDLNSVSPETKREAAKVIDGAGGRFVEAVVMTPFAWKGIASAMLLGGAHAGAFLDDVAALGLEAKVVSETIGEASATKMCRSVFVKGIEGLLMESMLAARRYGVEQTVLASLNDLFPQTDWPELARYMIGNSVQHGRRRAEEMRESARTVTDAGVEPLMTRGTIARQEWAAERSAALPSRTDLGSLLDAILADAADGLPRDD